MSKKSNTLSAGRPSSRIDKAATLASLAETASMKRVNFDLAADAHAKLKIYAARRGKTIKDILTEFVDELPE